MESLQQLRELPVDDLRQKVTAIRKELFTLRVNQVSGRVERPSQFRVLRRHVARILTLVNEREQTPPVAAGATQASGRTGGRRASAPSARAAAKRRS
jgi:large subunit ribosomal protein L29